MRNRLALLLLGLLAAGCGGAPQKTQEEAPAPETRASAAGPAPAAAAPARRPDDQDPRPRVELVTSMGRIVLELDRERAPKTVANFLQYVADGFYDGTIFHRVVKGFVIQGGGFTEDKERKPTRPPIPLEAQNGLSNVRGTIAMARTQDPDSATSQFFINLKDNQQLDPRPRFPGYCVFGRVVEGMDVVDKIAGVEVVMEMMPGEVSTPVKNVVIRSARRL